MSEPQKTAAIFRHLRNEGGGTFEKILQERGFAVRNVDTPFEELRDFDPLEPDLLMVMGGPIGVYDAPGYPFLYEEIRILEKRLAANRPVLGVCLGSQLMAKALGADVYKGKQGKEIGWGKLILTKEAENTPARHYAPEHTDIFQWHGDTFDFPDGARLLASSDLYAHQIFTHGKNAIALQCHSELTRNMLQEWFVMFVKEVTGENPLIDVTELRAESDRKIGVLEAQSRKFFSEWLKETGL